MSSEKPEKPQRTLDETLLVHGSDYAVQELLVGSDVLDELNLSAGDFVEIGVAGNAGPALTVSGARALLPSQSIVMRVPAMSAPAKGTLRISLLRSVAEACGLSARQPVSLRAMAMQDAAIDWVELSFKDQHLSRGDIWHFRRHLINHEPTVHVGKTISFEAIRAQVIRMVRAGKHTATGVLTEGTKLRFRSRSAAFVLLIQVSAEMDQVDPASGELYHEKAIGFLRALFRRWKALGVSHSLSIVLFSRCYHDDLVTTANSCGRMPPSEGRPTRPAMGVATAMGTGGGSSGGVSDGEGPLMYDGAGRPFSDYYKLVAENEIRADWGPLLPTLKRHFLSFGPSLKRREATTSVLPLGEEMRAAGRGGLGGGLMGGLTSGLDGDLGGSLRAGVGGGGLGGGLNGGGGMGWAGGLPSSTAAHGNLLEAINLALDVLEQSYEEQVRSSRDHHRVRRGAAPAPRLATALTAQLPPRALVFHP